MLKALELCGFKSFADKTRFDFPAGITVVVGPNGSGKSNIVDAIKWVLGEQSAKSLRGKDMSDVIFKGSSGANARKPANSASATIILDNSDGRLLSDAQEIHVTRRVYRSGESEYLINNEPCRLKDIRNLFRGTGVGTDAYSLIEQGKVERLLQASAKDRRAIFEEAAGISRFKAQKLEAERRLERVQINLTRLADIVEEVGTRFRSIKNQAGKAARYKEYSDRLQELRTHVGLKDYRSFGEQLEGLRTQINGFVEAISRDRQAISDLTAQHQLAEAQVDQTATNANRLQEQVTSLREQLSQSESTAEIARQRIQDLTTREVEVRENHSRAQSQLGEVTRYHEQAQSELAQGKIRNHDLRENVGNLRRQLDTLDRQSGELSAQHETTKAGLQSRIDRVKEIAQKVSSHQVLLELQRQKHQKAVTERAGLDQQLSIQTELVADIERRRQECHQKAESSDSALALARQAAEALSARFTELQQRQAEQKAQFAGVSQRAKVIEELEKRQEGVSSGAQELLKAARHLNSEQADKIVGLVADLIQVDIRNAAIVDAALGDRAQYVVARDDRLAQDLAAGNLQVSGRVGILSLSGIYSLGSRLDIDLSHIEGIIGSVDTLVDTGGIHSGFVRSLLRGTWIVNDLATAFRIRQGVSDQVRYVTLSGEVLESDGTLLVGPKSSVEGLVSRRSELRALTQQAEGIRQELQSLDQAIHTVKLELKQSQTYTHKLVSENQVLSRELALHEAQLTAAQRDLSTVRERFTAAKQELEHAERESAQLETGLENLHVELQTHSRQVDENQNLIVRLQSQLDELNQKRRELASQDADARVELATSDQQLADLENRVSSLAQQRTQLDDRLKSTADEWAIIQKALEESTTAAKAAGERITLLTQEREGRSAEYNQLQTERLELDRKRKDIAHQLQGLRDRQRAQEDQLNDSQFHCKRLELERSQLAERLQEDYGIDVASIEQSPLPEDSNDRAAIDREITELRQKISAMGAVNMQALVELEELENRYQTLDNQYKDLVEARDSLLRIIQKINQDSRRLFVETLEAIRTNFQKLFRQTFGGGQADILLEEGVDVLEAGVEIVATPPGKPKFSNSLLSGGEKALTAVSLLMAIFQFRPSPFCVLDEVDAPFDEANIGRFIDVLKSFLGWTKFVIVTHSKKTMTAATTLYGITMQESGVSKRVSVRFEDVSEDGQISKEAVRRSETEAAAS